MENVKPLPENKFTQSPVDYQLTVHKDNYEAYYGPGSFVRDLFEANTPVMSNLIYHYGFSRIMGFVDEYKIAG